MLLQARALQTCQTMNDKCQLNIVFQGAAVSAQQNTHQLVHHILVVELVLDRVGHHTGMRVDTLDLHYFTKPSKSRSWGWTPMLHNPSIPSHFLR